MEHRKALRREDKALDKILEGLGATYEGTDLYKDTKKVYKTMVKDAE